MTFEQLICMKNTGTKLIVTEMDIKTLEQHRIFEGYETNLCDDLNPEFEAFYGIHKGREIINFSAVMDRNGIPSINVLVYA